MILKLKISSAGLKQLAADDSWLLGKKDNTKTDNNVELSTANSQKPLEVSELNISFINGQFSLICSDHVEPLTEGRKILCNQHEIEVGIVDNSYSSKSKKNFSEYFNPKFAVNKDYQLFSSNQVVDDSTNVPQTSKQNFDPLTFLEAKAYSQRHDGHKGKISRLSSRINNKDRQEDAIFLTADTFE